jgi:quercetin dioxygenase-like cupin family protein
MVFLLEEYGRAYVYCVCFNLSPVQIFGEVTIEYVPNSVVIKTILKKTTGNVTVLSIDSGEALTERTIPFDTFIQVIDGKAEIVVDDSSKFLETGQSMIIPAHSKYMMKANVRFKVISTVIKSGYDM